MNQTTKNMATAGRAGITTFDARLAAQVQVKTTHGASSPNQLGKNHHRHRTAWLSPMVLSTSMSHPAAAQIFGTKIMPPITTAIVASTNTAADPQSLACLMSGSVSRETRSASRSTARSEEHTSELQS